PRTARHSFPTRRSSDLWWGRRRRALHNKNRGGILMKDLLTDALQKKVSAALSATGGINALYGEPVKIGNDEVVPVGRIAIELSADRKSTRLNSSHVKSS